MTSMRGHHKSSRSSSSSSSSDPSANSTAASSPSSASASLIFADSGNSPYCFSDLRQKQNELMYSASILHFHLPSLIGCILLNDICLFVLEVTQRQKNDITGIDPDLEGLESKMMSFRRAYLEKLDLPFS